MKPSLKSQLLAVIILGGVIWPGPAARGRGPSPEISLIDLQKVLAGKKFVDLTHDFAPGIPHWSGFPNEQRRTIYWYEKQPSMMGDGSLAEIFTHVGRWGTHVDPPAHFHKGLRTVDQIELKEMILPLVCIDVHEDCAKNADYTLALERAKKGETDHGTVPAGAFVAMRTDWSKRWPDAEELANKDEQGVAHYPGWSLPAVKYLYEERKITASGHETTDTDPGLATTKDDYSLEPTSSAPTIIRSNCSRISIRCRRWARSSSSVSQNQKAAPVFPLAFLPFCLEAFARGSVICCNREKRAPDNFRRFEDRGPANEMARKLVEVARRDELDIRIFAFT